MLSSKDANTVEEALYGAEIDSIPEGPQRQAVKKRVRLLLQASGHEVTRASILASQYGRLDIVNDPGGAELVRTAIERYNPRAETDKSYERLSLRSEAGYYWVGIEHRRYRMRRQ